ncbi:putative heparin sulfate cell surface proteoglycan, partial [Operophtera brumata]
MAMDIDGICLKKGCCGAGARSRLSQQARSQLEGALRSELTKLSDMLANRATRFDEFFRKLLKLSREEFHSMFKRTYGMIYEQHSYVFEQLFEQLERYYARGDTNFSVMMDGFFGILYEKMFTVLNSQYQFDEKYLKCLNENMRDIQPFEDVPNKLTMQLKRAVVATRTFHKALRTGADVVRNMIQ